MNQKNISESSTRFGQRKESNADLEDIQEVNNVIAISEIKETISRNKTLAVAGLHEQAKRMKIESDSKYSFIEKGSIVTVPVPFLDRGKGDAKNIIGVVMEVTADNYYKIGTINGILSQLYSRNQIAACKSNLLRTEDVPDKICTLRTASNKQSRFGGQGFVRCNCVKKCTDAKCQCRKKELKCNSKCHKALDCTNK